MMADLPHILLVDVALSCALFIALWITAIVIRDPSFIDAWWALGVVVLALATFAQLPEHTTHALILTGLASLWGLRLGTYLFWRWRKQGRDRRYTKILDDAKEKRKWGFAIASLLLVFAPQFALQFILALPVTLGQAAAPYSFGPVAAAGAVLAGFGIIYEMVADLQLAHFKSLPANDGQLMDKGLWRTSRHPNYFAEMCTWWGLWLLACETLPGAFTIVSPILLTFLLTRVSGAPTTEPHLQQTRPAYTDYKARTSAFIPWPPKHAKPQS
jgi:steroid 5-alpha reductase family enzyme